MPGCPMDGAVLSGIQHPNMSVLPTKTSFLAVNGRSGFPGTENTSQQPLPPPCLLVPQDSHQGCHQPVPAGLHPWVPPPHPTGICHLTLQPGTLCPHSCYHRASLLQAGASTALPRALGHPLCQYKPQLHDAQEPYPGHGGTTITSCLVLRCDRDSAVQLARNGTIPEGRGSPSPLTPAKVTGVLMAPSEQPLISFIDPFSMESSN